MQNTAAMHYNDDPLGKSNVHHLYLYQKQSINDNIISKSLFFIKIKMFYNSSFFRRFKLVNIVPLSVDDNNNNNMLIYHSPWIFFPIEPRFFLQFIKMF